MQIEARPKKRYIAALLAVFFAFFTWLYTYKRDSWKFWAGLIGGFSTSFITGGWGLFAVWVWAIIDTTTKSDAWYESFPDKPEKADIREKSNGKDVNNIHTEEVSNLIQQPAFTTKGSNTHREDFYTSDFNKESIYSQDNDLHEENEASLEQENVYNKDREEKQNTEQPKDPKGPLVFDKNNPHKYKDGSQ